MERLAKGFWINVLIERAVELLIVFIGVYAAFMLNSYQNRQQERERRNEILAYLQKRTKPGVEDLRSVTSAYDKRLDVFLAQLDKGDMPEVSPISWASDYNASATAWLLQAGGMGLLDIDTLAKLKDVDSAAATGQSIMAHYQQLSDQLIVPHFGEQSYFYDSTTKQLQGEYAQYPGILKEGSTVLHNLLDKTDQLEKQIELEQNKLK